MIPSASKFEVSGLVSDGGDPIPERVRDGPPVHPRAAAMMRQRAAVGLGKRMIPICDPLGYALDAEGVNARRGKFNGKSGAVEDTTDPNCKAVSVSVSSKLSAIAPALDEQLDGGIFEHVIPTFD